jgi:formiminoglutamate deiminase
VTTVGEFHYLHLGSNAMGEALASAAGEAGVRLTLLDTLYLHGGLGFDGYAPLNDVQRRFSDGSFDAWARRVAQRSSLAGPMVRLGVAAHSVRAVDPEALCRLAQWSAGSGMVVHAHVSEQVAENEQCQRQHGCSPMALLDSVGLLSPAFTAVHATHVSDDDIDRLASAGATVCLCPTTERDLADGIGPSSRFAENGIPLCLGSDSHAVIDLFEEARLVELQTRLATMTRGHHHASALLTMATAAGHRALGWPECGQLVAGAPADFVTVRATGVRRAGAPRGLEGLVFGATADDVTDVVVAGEPIVRDGVHTRVDVEAELAASIDEVMPR